LVIKIAACFGVIFCGRTAGTGRVEFLHVAT
jgi:hypothetical protein